MEQDALNAIMAEIEAGRQVEARAALRPALLAGDGASDASVCYLLGRTFFGHDNATARYLFERALALDPGFEEAGRHEARCGSAIEDLEDFTGPRHVRCGQCALHYREHEPVCPLLRLARFRAGS